MSYRLRSGLRQALLPLRGLLFRETPQPSAPPVLRGKLRRAVVVPSPDAHFTEAIFLLRDDLLRDDGLDREALLREAARAAERRTADMLPPSPRPALRPAAAFLLGALGMLLALRLAGML